MSNREIATKLGGFLFAVSAVCVLMLMITGAYPLPLNGRAMGETLGAVLGIWLAACAGAGLAWLIVDPHRGLITGTIVAVVVSILSLLGSWT